MDSPRGAEVLTRMRALLGEDPPPRGGAVWRLDPPERQLDANVVRLPPGAEVTAHAEPDLDVLLYVAAGGGRLDADTGGVELTPGCVVWLPRGAHRALTAGPDGLTHLTVHRRRPALTIAPRRPDQAPAAEPEGGEPACLLHRVCIECARFAPEPDARYCARCGTELPTA